MCYTVLPVDSQRTRLFVTFFTLISYGLIRRPWSWRRHDAPKHLVASNRLHCVILQKTGIQNSLTARRHVPCRETPSPMQFPSRWNEQEGMWKEGIECCVGDWGLWTVDRGLRTVDCGPLRRFFSFFVFVFGLYKSRCSGVQPDVRIPQGGTPKMLRSI